MARDPATDGQRKAASEAAARVADELDRYAEAVRPVAADMGPAGAELLKQLRDWTAAFRTQSRDWHRSGG